MSDFKCPFCGSQKLKIETPYIKPVTHERETTYCCRKQAKNQEFVEKRYHPIYGIKPSVESISTL